MDLQPIFDIAEICYQKGIKRAIISPGSRNAPLTIAFTRHSGISCYSVPDERSAGFLALGMSLKTREPTALICTSGSAALNYAPAVAEAFFAQVPLLVLTADRPPEWIGQLDGQTVFQEHIFGRHIKASFNFPDNFEFKESLWYCHRMINEAINSSAQYPKGPVHINLPFREPFYPEKDQDIDYSENIKLIKNQLVKIKSEINYLSINEYDKILIIIGQQTKNNQLNSLLSSISSQLNIPIVADVISNGHHISGCIRHQDAFLKNPNNYEKLKPDLIITFGLSIISKNLKLFLRKVNALEHWHIQQAGHVADTFQGLSQVVQIDPTSFFEGLESALSSIKPKEHSFYSHWKQLNEFTGDRIKSSLKIESEFNEFSAFELILSNLPEKVDLHLANSMAVRYANFLGVYQKDIEIFCNRGTSGIDGSTSTTIGSALCSDRLTILITGDMAFFYDRNAFWHNHLPKNIKIIVLNNHGGGIFRMIDGPSSQPDFEQFFETNQKLLAKNLSNEYSLDYYHCPDQASLEQSLTSFFSQTDTPAVLEIETDSRVNQQIYSRIMAEEIQ